MPEEVEIGHGFWEYRRVHDTNVKDIAGKLEEQVQSLQHELESPMANVSPAAGKLPVADAQRLKRAIDDFRLFLWAYIDAWSEKRSETAGTLQRIRLQAAADMLTALRSELTGKALPDTPEGRALRLALQTFSQMVRS